MCGVTTGSASDMRQNDKALKKNIQTTEQGETNEKTSNRRSTHTVYHQ